jgi:hypothetical protein
MNRDDERLSITLTVKQWRDIKAVIGELQSGPEVALYDALDTWDLDPVGDTESRQG